MPIYEYECEKCNATFEVMQSVSAKPLKNHKSEGCDGKVRRLVSASGFILKGSGWYATDYPSEARKQGWEKEQKQASPAAPDSKAPAEAPAAKSETKAPAPKPAAKKPASKNPYAGGKKTKAKPAK